MLQIKFYPDSDRENVTQAIQEYQQIWENEGPKFVEVIEKTSGLKFVESFINVIVFEGPSRSRPLCLRASYDVETKKATLIHELCHRLFIGNKITKRQDINDSTELVSHKNINLILYDIWVELFGRKVADHQVQVESVRQPFYKDAWVWTLSITAEERKVKLKELCSR